MTPSRGIDTASGPGCRVAARVPVAANWRILVENHNECLHSPTVHPQLVSLVPIYQRGEVEEEPGQTGSGNQLRTGPPPSRLRAVPACRSCPAGTGGSGHVLRSHAASKADHQLPLRHVSAFLLQPEGPAETRVTCQYLFAPEAVAAADFDPSHRS
jgi:Rieske 2Fe-2S family protein